MTDKMPDMRIYYGISYKPDGTPDNGVEGRDRRRISQALSTLPTDLYKMVLRENSGLRDYVMLCSTGLRNDQKCQMVLLALCPGEQRDMWTEETFDAEVAKGLDYARPLAEALKAMTDPFLRGVIRLPQPTVMVCTHDREGWVGWVTPPWLTDRFKNGWKSGDLHYCIAPELVDWFA